MGWQDRTATTSLNEPASAQRFAEQLWQFRATLTPAEQSAFDAVLRAAVGDTGDLVAHGFGAPNSPVGRLAHAIGVSATALAILLSVGGTATPAAAATLAPVSNASAIVAQVPTPDLTVTNASVDPVLNGVTTVRYTVVNKGDRRARAFWVAVYADAKQIEEFHRESGLDAGYEYTVEHKIQVGNATSVSILVDSRLSTGETLTRDDVVKLTLRQARPELDMSFVHAAKVVYNTSSVGFIVHNTGKATAGAFYVSVYGDDNRLLAEKAFPAGLQPQKNYESTFQVPNVGDTTHFKVVVDSHNEVLEANDQNNTRTIVVPR